jgi:hypothetical protein
MKLRMQRRFALFLCFALFEYTHTTQDLQKDEDSYTHFSAITDSVRDQANLMAPNDPMLTPMANAEARGMAVLTILTGRRQAASNPPAADPTCWTKPQASPDIVFHSRGPAWREVNVKPADRLPLMTAEGMTHFRVNQFCQDCMEWELCSTHAALVSNDNVDFIPKHFNAMKAAGYCLVECGGEGDCFYHSMLFLARIHNAHLYQAWQDHNQFRKNTCDKLLVFHYLHLLRCDDFEYTQHVSRFPTICLE